MRGLRPPSREVAVLEALRPAAPRVCQSAATPALAFGRSTLASQGPSALGWARKGRREFGARLSPLGVLVRHGHNVPL